MLPKSIEVAIGTAFLFLLLTFAASAVLELLSAVLNWRAKMLYATIGQMLKNCGLVSVNKVYSNPLIQTLGRDSKALAWSDLIERFGGRLNGISRPSYIPPANFSGAILDEILSAAPPAAGVSTVDAIKNAMASSTANAQQGANALTSLLRTTLATQGDSIQALRMAIEKWFTDTNDRTSGWYKRRTQFVLLIIGLVAAFSLNIDSFAIATWLWNTDASREAAVTASAQYVKEHPARAATSGTPADPQKPAGTPGAAASSSNPTGSLTDQLTDVSKQISDLKYPIGTNQNRGNWWFLGEIITAVAISMGSTFWFDALQSLLKLRSAGPKPTR